MPKSNVVARVLEADGLECRVRSPRGEELSLSGTTSDVEPRVVDGSTPLAENRALVDNAWAFAKFTHLAVSLATDEEQKAAAKRAEAHRDVTKWLADLAEDVTDETEHSWCSGCFALTDHRKVTMGTGQVPAYLCSACGSPTLPCAGPGCRNMAVRGRGAVRVPRFCAEHRHEITGFAKAERKMAALSDYQEFLRHDEPNLSRITKLVGVGIAGIAVGAPAALAAAPAIGGAVGAMIGGYNGAAATSYGLALLGGGSLAAGGFGMAGGTVVVTAAGGALGCALGASVTNAYVREDKSFHIEMLQGGNGVPVIVCNGFLSEGGRGWGEWKRIITERYPFSPVYRVHWGSKELDDLGIIAGAGSVRAASATALKEAAMAATKAGGKRLTPLAPAMLSADLARNPWNVAKSRAGKTGVILADLVARTETGSYVLVGHSLGARAMVFAAQTLSSKPDAPRLEAVHLLGAAIGAHGDWRALTARVDDAVYCYHSQNDKVLKYLYRFAQAGQVAAGSGGFATAGNPKLRNIDVSTMVQGHSDYHAHVALA